MKRERESNNNPLEKRAFFEKEVTILAQELQGKVITDLKTGKWVKLTRPEAWPEVGRRYQKELVKLAPGDFIAFHLPVRRMCQALIIAKGSSGNPACIRVLRAARLLEQENHFVEMEREGDLTRFLELAPNETGKLAFLDESDILYFIRTAREEITLEEANSEWNKLLE